MRKVRGILSLAPLCAALAACGGEAADSPTDVSCLGGAELKRVNVTPSFTSGTSIPLSFSRRQAGADPVSYSGTLDVLGEDSGSYTLELKLDELPEGAAQFDTLGANNPSLRPVLEGVRNYLASKSFPVALDKDGSSKVEGLRELRTGIRNAVLGPDVDEQLEGDTRAGRAEFEAGLRLINEFSIATILSNIEVLRTGYGVRAVAGSGADVDAPPNDPLLAKRRARLRTGDSSGCARIEIIAQLDPEVLSGQVLDLAYRLGADRSDGDAQMRVTGTRKTDLLYDAERGIIRKSSITVRQEIPTQGTTEDEIEVVLGDPR